MVAAVSSRTWPRGCVGVFAFFVLAGVLRPATAVAQVYIQVDSNAVSVAENGGTYRQPVWLSDQPTTTVTVQVASADTTVATVSPTMLTFTPSNYSTKQWVTFTGVDDSILNSPPQHRRTTVTYTASGGNYDGVQNTVTVFANDDEPVLFTVQEGRSYTVKFGLNVRQGCTPVVMTLEVSDPSVLSVDPSTLSWTFADSGMQKPVKLTFHDNNVLEDSRVTLSLPYSQPPCRVEIPLQDIIFTVVNNDTWDLSVKGVPACGATVTDTSVQPQIDFLLKPAPAVEMATEYRPISEDNSERWQGSLPITTSGRSISFHHSPLSSLRRAFPGFKGFEYRLKDAPDVTARCTWEFEDTGTTPTVTLSASPNPVDEGSNVTVTASLSSALSSNVTIPLSLTRGTAEDGDYGSLSGITLSSGQTSGSVPLSTNHDTDTDDETFTVALGTLPAGVRAGSPNSVTVTIRDDDTVPTDDDDGGPPPGGGPDGDDPDDPDPDPNDPNDPDPDDPDPDDPDADELHIAPYWRGGGGFAVRPADGRSAVMRLRCGQSDYESREYAGQDGLIVRLVKLEACAGREGELTFEGIDDDGWYWINGDYNAALAPLVRESSLRPELRPPIPDGVTASPSGDRRFMLSVTGRLHGTLVEHEANGFIGIIPHIVDLEGAGRHAAPFWRGHGGVAGRPIDGVSATFRLTCADGRSYAYELEPRPDGFIAHLLDGCFDAAGEPIDGQLEADGLEDGAWYWLNHGRLFTGKVIPAKRPCRPGSCSAAAPLVRRDADSDSLTRPVVPGGVTADQGPLGTLFTQGKRFGIVTSWEPIQ